MPLYADLTEDLQRSRDREMKRAMVPAGSLTWVRVEVDRNGQYADEDGVSTAQSGLKRVNLKLYVLGQQYEGSIIWESITLPEALQADGSWTDGQRKSMSIGGESIAKILASSKRPLRGDIIAGLDGAQCPIKVGMTKPEGDRQQRNNVAAWLDPDNEHDKLAQKILMPGSQVIEQAPITVGARPAGVTRQQPAPRSQPAPTGYGQPIRRAEEPEDDIPF